MKAPRNLSGFVIIPRQWWRESRAMTSRQRELYLILTACADWDPRHQRFGLVRFSCPDLAEFADPAAWSRSTFKRTISSLILTGELQRLGYGEYRIVKMAQFLTARIRDRAASTPLGRMPKSPPLSQGGPRVARPGSPMDQRGSQVGQLSDFSDEKSAPKNVKNLKNESTGDFFLDAKDRIECPHLSPLKRASLLTAVAQAFTCDSERAKAGAAIIGFHSTRIAREFPCSRAACHDAVVILLQAVWAKAKSNPLGYFTKGLSELLEDSVDTAIREKEKELLARPPQLDGTIVAVSRQSLEVQA